MIRRLSYQFCSMARGPGGLPARLWRVLMRARSRLSRNFWPQAAAPLIRARSRLPKKELGIFLIVGTLTVIVDFMIYRGLVIGLAADVDLAKGAGFVAGTVFAYFVNRFWTFGGRQHARGSAVRFIALYAGTLAVNVLINGVGLVVLASIGQDVAVAAAFIAATGVSATLNFAGMKWFVFREAA
jgi:putative flippase GtrA